MISTRVAGDRFLVILLLILWRSEPSAIERRSDEEECDEPGRLRIRLQAVWASDSVLLARMVRRVELECIRPASSRDVENA